MNRGRNDNRGRGDFGRGRPFRGRGRGESGIRSDAEEKLPEIEPEKSAVYIPPPLRERDGEKKESEKEVPTAAESRKETEKTTAQQKVTPQGKADVKGTKAFGYSLDKDPAALDAFGKVQGFEARPCIPEFTLASCLNGFNLLVDTIYGEIESCAPFFTELVPRSAFVYYCGVLVCARLVHITQCKGRGDDTMDTFINRIKDMHLVTPDIFLRYIRNFGDVYHKDIGLVRWQANPEELFDDNRDFGRVSAHTHSLYESYVSLRVLETRLMNDIDAGLQWWNLPEQLRPDEEEAGLPTVNLIGYGEFCGLTQKQRQFYETAGVTVDSIDDLDGSFAVLEQMMRDISARLAVISDRFQIKSFELGTSSGSVAQIYEIVRQEPVYGTVLPDRSRGYCDGALKLYGAYEADARVTIVAQLHLFRMRREEGAGNTRPYACYSFDNYTQVPNNWHVSRNQVFERGNFGQFRTPSLESQLYDRQDIVLRCVRHDVIDKANS